MDIDDAALLQAVERARHDRYHAEFVEDRALRRSTASRLGRHAGREPTMVSLRKWLAWLALDERPNAAFVDTTFIHTIARLTLGDVNPRHVNAPTIMDLGAFAAAAILCDSVVHLPNANESLALNEALGEPLLVELPVVEFDAAEDPPAMPVWRSPADEYEAGLHGVAATLGNLMEDAAMEVEALGRSVPGEVLHADVVAMATQWSALLGRPVEPSDLRYTQELSRWRSDGPELLGTLLDFQDDALDAWATDPDRMRAWAVGDSELAFASFISECNTRSFFNLRVADLLDVPYVGSATRLPIRAHQYRRAGRVQSRLHLLGLLDAQVGEQVAHYVSPHQPNLRLPVFGALALRDAETPHDVLRRIGELRIEASAFRAHRVEFDQALVTGDGRTAALLLQALADDGNRLVTQLACPAGAGIAAVLAAAAGPTTLLALGAIGLLTTVANLQPGVRRSVRRRLLRPSQWWLTSTRHAATAIASSAGDVQRVFDLDDRSVDTLRRRLGELAEVGLG